MSIQNQVEQSPISTNSLLSHAYEYLRGLRILAAAGSSPPITVMGMLAAHALELTLKGYLVSKGMVEGDFIGPNKIGHNLEAALQECEKRGLKLTVEKTWMNLLDIQHNKPFLYRYGRDGWGQSIPGDPVSLTDYVERVMRQVCDALGQPVG